MLNSFSSAARVTALVSGLFVLGGCSTFPIKVGGEDILHRDFSSKEGPCFSEFNTRSHRLEVSVTCTGSQISAAQKFYGVSGVGIIRKHEGSRFLGTHQRVPVDPTGEHLHEHHHKVEGKDETCSHNHPHSNETNHAGTVVGKNCFHYR